MEPRGDWFTADDQRDDASGRRAIVVLAIPAPAGLTAEIGREPAASIAVYTLLDLLALLGPLDGVSIAVACADREHADLVGGLLPAGIELLRAPSGAGEMPSLARWALTAHLERGNVRVVALTGDVVDVPARTVATALGTLASADVAIGAGRDGRFYLFGARDAAGIALLDESESTAEALVARAQALGLTTRRLEPCRRLADLASLRAIQEVAAAELAALPRLNDALRQMSRPAE